MFNEIIFGIQEIKLDKIKYARVCAFLLAELTFNHYFRQPDLLIKNWHYHH